MDVNAQQQLLLDKHLKCVLESNKIHNLTTINDKNEAKILHVEDSLAALPELNNAKSGKMVDLGSGAGYPGIPLAIVSGRETTLIESVGKKADCLESFIKELNYESHISVINNRIEEVAAEEGNSYSVATARALSSFSSLLELASPLLCSGGCLICFKSDNIEQELEDSLKIQDKLGMSFLCNRKYELSNGVTHRIVCFKKTKDATIKLPRKLGLAQKRPIR